MSDQRRVVEKFSRCINAQDLDGLGRLMTEDHTFIDSGGDAWPGREACMAAWSGFFTAFPDYHNVFTELDVRDDVVVITGRSVCEEPALDGPAIWTVRVEEGKVAEWHVYEGTAEERVELGLS